MKEKLMTGTGMSIHSFDREGKKVSIDFTGDSPEGCYRNDASIVFFAANSYRASNYALRDEIKRRFESNYSEKDIEHLIMPYYFSFRHAIELYLKAIIVSISGVSPENIHGLSKLSSKLDSMLQGLAKPSDSQLSDQLFNERKGKAISLFQDLSNMISMYERKEPSEEYYRYIFGLNKKKDFLLSDPNLTLDFSTISDEFNNVFWKIHNLCVALREADIYVYFTL